MSGLEQLRQLSPQQAFETLEALFRSASGYVVYRLRRVPIEESPLGGAVVVVSPSIREVMGVDDPDDLSTWFAGVLTEDLPRVARAQMACFNDGVPFDEVFRMTVRGETRWVHAISHPVTDEAGDVFYNGLVVDVTERLRAERELRTLQSKLEETQRRETLGSLAANVAHDFNNLLQGIMGTAAMAAAESRDDARLQELMEEVIELVARGASLTRDLLASARPRRVADPLSASCNVNAAAERVGRLVDRMFVGLTVTVTPTDDVAVGAIDGGDLEQVLLNLTLNAAQATRRVGQVDLAVTVEDGRIQVRVSDDGPGVPEGIREAIFEDFFTTKTDDGGTGLGLANARRVIERWGGELTLEDAAPPGATFRIELTPFVPREEEVRPVAPRAGRVESILIVDDEERLRATLAHHLRRRGYEVASAGTLTDALAMWHRRPDGFGLVVTDTVMPRRGGLELLASLRSERPELPAVVMSGLAPSREVEEMVAKGTTVFLAKPFRLERLDESIATLCPADDD